jgi:hypothetical protein
VHLRFNLSTTRAGKAPMASEIYSRVSPDEVARRFRDERVEPDLGPRGALRVRTQRRKPLQAPEILAPSRPSDAAKAPVGMLVHLVSVGLVAATIIGVFFGTGFFLLVSPASERITDRYPPHVYGNGAEGGRQGVLVSHLAAVDVPPGSPLSQRPAVDEAVPLAQSTAVQEFPPARPNGDPPVAASVPEPASDSVPLPASPTPSANPPPFVAEVAVLPAGAKARPARDGHYAHTHTASRHSRPTFHPRRTKA